MDQTQINLDHGFASDEGRVREANEDFCGSRMTVNGFVFTVCDGMGGHVAGEMASRLAVECILDYFEEPRENLIVAINDALRLANTYVFDKASSDPELRGMGTTATVLLVNGTDCYVGHVGDSRIYLKSQGKLNRLTKDHSFVQQLVDRGIISDTEMESHPKKNQILQAIGVKPDVDPAVCGAPIKPSVGDCFLLCSDGLNGMIQDREIESIIDSDHLQESCDNLISAANNAGGEDNVTAILVTITESPYATSTFEHFNPVVAETTLIQEQTYEEPSAKKKTLLYVILGVLAASAIVMAFLAYNFFIEKDTEGEQDPTKVEEQDEPSKKKESDTSDEKLQDGRDTRDPSKGDQGGSDAAESAGKENQESPKQGETKPADQPKPKKASGQKDKPKENNTEEDDSPPPPPEDDPVESGKDNPDDKNAKKDEKKEENTEEGTTDPPFKVTE